MSKTMTRDEKIAKLGKIITDRKEVLLGLEKVTPDAPEYWGIDCGLQYVVRRYGKDVETDCLDTALLMGKRKPKTFAQLQNPGSAVPGFPCGIPQGESGRQESGP